MAIYTFSTSAITIDGGAGSNRITSRQGNDVLTGGLVRDSFNINQRSLKYNLMNYVG